MLSFDVSKISYGKTLAQFLHVVLGGAAILGVACYSPAVRAMVRSSDLHTSILVVGGIASIFAAYLVGTIIYAPFGVLINLLSAFASRRAKKEWQNNQLTEPWIAITDAFLLKAGMSKTTEGNRRAWFVAFHQIFPEDQMVNSRMGALMAGLGFILLGLSIQYPAARTWWIFIAAPITVFSGFHYIWRAVSRTSDPARSLVRQQQSMMTVLLRDNNKDEPAPQAAEQSTKSAAAGT